MASLLSTIKDTIDKKHVLPFAVYTSIKEQKLLNVPIVKPLLIVVLSGNKELGNERIYTAPKTEIRRYQCASN